MLINSPIITSHGQTVTNTGLDLKENPVVFLSTTHPILSFGDMAPIEIEPANSEVLLEPGSRLMFGKTFPIDWKVAVKELGKVAEKDMTRMLALWHEKDCFKDSDDEEGGKSLILGGTWGRHFERI